MIDNVLYDYMREQMGFISLDFVRYKYKTIDWNLRMIGLIGPRGVGVRPAARAGRLESSRRNVHYAGAFVP